MYELQLWYSYGGMNDYIMKRGKFKDLMRRIKLIDGWAVIERIELRRMLDEEVYEINN